MFAEVALSRYLNLAHEVLKLSICSSSLHCLELHNKLTRLLLQRIESGSNYIVTGFQKPG
jgi:hypothetical protein